MVIEKKWAARNHVTANATPCDANRRKLLQTENWTIRTDRSNGGETSEISETKRSAIAVRKDSVLYAWELSASTKMEVKIREIAIMRRIHEFDNCTYHVFYFQIEILSTKSSKVIANVNVSKAQ